MNGTTTTNKLDFESSQDRPPIQPVIAENIPEHFKSRNRWFLWIREKRDGRWSKVPVVFDRNRKRWRRCRINLPSDWLDFDTAMELHRHFAPWSFTGLGYWFSEDETHGFIDLDDALIDGKLTPWAEQIVDQFNSYTEISPSGTGVKIFAQMRKPGDRCHSREKKGIEFYDKRKYAAFTGNIWPGSPKDAEHRQAEAEALYLWMFPDDTPEARQKREASNREIAARISSGQLLESRDSRIVRARNYIAKMPPAISGNHGHNATFAIACKLVEFDLEYHDALDLLSDWNLTLDELWSLGELKHKLDGAFKHAARGKLLEDRSDRDAISSENYSLLAASLPNVFGAPCSRLIGSASRESTIPQIEAAVRVPTVKLAAPFPEPKHPAPSNTIGTGSGSKDLDYALGDYLKPPTLAEMHAEVAAANANKRASRLAHAGDRPEAITCHVHGFLYHPERERYRTARFACGRWCCLRCSKHLKRIWTQHLQSRIETQRVPGQPASVRRPRPGPVFVEVVGPDSATWAKLRKRLHRADAQYVRIRVTSDQMLVVATRSFSDSCEEAKPTDAAAQVVKAINDLLIFGDTKKPIHTSKAWRLPRDEPSGWKYIGGLPADAKTSEILGAIRKLGGDPETKKPPYPFFVWAADFTIPIDADDSERIENEGWRPLAVEVHRKLSAMLEGIELTPEAERLLFG